MWFFESFERSKCGCGFCQGRGMGKGKGRGKGRGKGKGRGGGGGGWGGWNGRKERGFGGMGMGKGKGSGMGRGKGKGKGKGGQRKKPPKVFPGKYFENLKAVVMEKICSNCSACVVACPVKGIEVVSYSSPPDFPTWNEDCIDCGFCVRVCPRWNYKPLSGLGNYSKAIAVKSKRFTGQDGGAVTEILACAMEAGIIEAALVVTRDEKWKPQAYIAENVDELRLSSGTKYSHAYPLSALRAMRREIKSIAIAGTPCVVSAARKLQAEVGKYRKRISMVVGVFCMENFYYPDIVKFLESKGVKIEEVEKMDIKKGKFIVKPQNVSFPVKELDEIVPKGCKVCQDFTAVESDISVGSVGSPDGFSTVILRNESFAGLIESLNAEFDEVNMDVVKKLAEFKVKIHPV